jgi:hypothetical protein
MSNPYNITMFASQYFKPAYTKNDLHKCPRLDGKMK